MDEVRMVETYGSAVRYVNRDKPVIRVEFVVPECGIAAEPGDVSTIGVKVITEAHMIEGGLVIERAVQIEADIVCSDMPHVGSAGRIGQIEPLIKQVLI